MNPDAVNALFEVLGALFVVGSIFKLSSDKMVRGVFWLQPTFFSFWGFWNLYFYPYLDQWVSFWAGLFMVTVNTTWLVMFFYYGRQERINGFSR